MQPNYMDAPSSKVPCNIIVTLRASLEDTLEKNIKRYGV